MLRALFVPSVFVLVLAMTYRYLFHLLNGVTDMYTARQARTVTRDTDVTKGRGFVAATGGALFGKAHALSEEVHQAMVSRGYTGSHRTLQHARVRAVDALWILACAGCAIRPVSTPCTMNPAKRPRQMPRSVSASFMPQRLACLRKLWVIRSATTIKQTSPGF